METTENNKTTTAIPKTSNMLLQVKDLHTYFFTEEGVVRAVDGVSFGIKKDEILGLVGETGCGKSVTALSILKLIRTPGEIVSGTVLFNGKDLSDLNENEIRHYRGNNITMIFQDPMNSLNPVLKIGEQIREVYLLHQMNFLKEERAQRIQNNNELKTELEQLMAEKARLHPKEEDTRDASAVENSENKQSEISEHELQIDNRIQELQTLIKKKISIEDIANEEAAKILTQVGIADSHQILDRYPHELSGGMRQRVMISMALACESQLLIADEPTTALDVTIQAQILELIRNLKKRLHNSVLLITHSLGVIYELCDKVAVMYSGNIIEYGDVKEIMQKPFHPYTKGLLSSIPKVLKSSRDKKLSTIPGSVPNLIYPPDGCRFHPRCQFAMNICNKVKPVLSKPTETAPKFSKVACHLYNPLRNDPQKKELFEKLEIKEDIFEIDGGIL